MTFTESTIEETTLEWLKDLGYSIVFGGDIEPEEPAAERESYLGTIHTLTGTRELSLRELT
jgi:hypothetical protein